MKRLISSQKIHEESIDRTLNSIVSTRVRRLPPPGGAALSELHALLHVATSPEGAGSSRGSQVAGLNMYRAGPYLVLGKGGGSKGQFICPEVALGGSGVN